ncbi:MAG: hypothetical protein JO337_09515 [Acidimicrobiales bacterium]|nr:hypothetical protein [Acidimicrobiales bacterium]
MTSAESVRTRPPMSRGESTVRRVLVVPEGKPTAGEDQAHRLFSVSIALSATRCLATYVILPVVTPLIGPSTGTGPEIGIPLSILALVFDVRALRRFWLADHRWRWRMTILYGLLMVLVTALLGWDIAHLTG